jgi:uncharacterized membrane protein YtjA (UPF0391 family)
VGRIRPFAGRRYYAALGCDFFLVIAIVAGILGFAGLMVAAAGIAKLLFYLFLILFLITLISGLVNRNKV